MRTFPCPQKTAFSTRSSTRTNKLTNAACLFHLSPSLSQETRLSDPQNICVNECVKCTRSTSKHTEAKLDLRIFQEAKKRPSDSRLLDHIADFQCMSPSLLFFDPFSKETLTLDVPTMTSSFKTVQRRRTKGRQEKQPQGHKENKVPRQDLH